MGNWIAWSFEKSDLSAGVGGQDFSPVTVHGIFWDSMPLEACSRATSEMRLREAEMSCFCWWEYMPFKIVALSDHAPDLSARSQDFSNGNLKLRVICLRAEPFWNFDMLRGGYQEKVTAEFTRIHILSEEQAHWYQSVQSWSNLVLSFSAWAAGAMILIFIDVPMLVSSFWINSKWIVHNRPFASFAQGTLPFSEFVDSRDVPDHMPRTAGTLHRGRGRVMLWRRLWRWGDGGCG